MWTSFKIYQYSGFKEGYDPGAGRKFDTDRQRNNWAAENGLRKLYHKPKGVLV